MPIKTTLVAPSPPPERFYTELPARLRVPSIGVDSLIEPLGLTPSGEMATSDSPDNVAWYKDGQRPGAIGSAVIAGHFGWKNNVPAVFDNLSKLQNGDKIHVTDIKGVFTTFSVRAIKNYEKDADAKDIFFSSDGKAHLNLISCIGSWDKSSQSYSDRLIVLADKD